VGENQGVRHILLADDDPLFLASMAKALRQGGYLVTEVGHFTAALAALEDATNKPDMLVTDVVMPGSVNGVALSRMARLRCPGMPTVYVTGYSVPDMHQTDFGPFLRKPISATDLIAAIEAEFAKHAAAP
jgi:DNA-binding NtrC family response regulator